MKFTSENIRRKTKSRLKKNDMVFIRTGKEKGKTGKILRIDYKSGRAFIQGLNMVKKAMRKSTQNDKGGIIEKEASIHLSNITLWDEKSNTTGRIGAEFKGGRKIRVIRKAGKEIHIS